MATDLEKLVVQLSADIRGYERALNRANGITNQRAAAIESRFQKMQKNIDATFMSVGKGALGFLSVQAALNLVNGAVERTKRALEDFGRIADASAASGLDAEFFQGLAYQASLAGVDMDNLSSSLETFSKNAGLAVVGKGKMVTALQKLNPALLEAIRNAKSQEERVRLAADAIDRASDASSKAALATTLFGNSGTRLVAVFSGGADAIDRTAQKARELGVIVDRDLIASADELGDKVDTLSQVLNANLNQAFVNLAPVMIATLEIFAKLANGLNILIDRSREFANQTTQGLNLQLTDIGKQRLDLENKILAAQEGQRSEMEAMQKTAIAPRYQAQMNATVSKAYDDRIAELKAQDAALAKTEQEILSVLAPRNAAKGASDIANSTADAPDLPPLPTSSSRSSSTSDAERQAKAVKDLIDNLEFELSLIGKSELEQAKMNALRQAGAAATADQKAKIAELVTQQAAEKKAVEATASAIEAQKEIVSGMLTDIRTALEDGKITWEEWGEIATNMLNKVADKLQQMLVDSLFQSGGIPFLTKLFGGTVGTGAAAAASAAASGAAKSAGNLPAGGLAKAPRIPRLPAASSPAGVSVVVNNLTNASVRTEESRDSRGGRRVTFVIEDEIAGAVTRPGSSAGRALRGNFGLAPRLIKR